jgi:hypothetical protein
MISPIVFTALESDKIENKMSEADFSSESWSDEDVSGLKKSIKKYYLAEQKNTCPYCQQVTKSNHGRCWDIEHIIPRSSILGFMFEAKNLCMSCIDCNQAKSNKVVTSSKAKKKYPAASSFFIVHPHFDKYSDHIIDIKPGFYYVAKSKKGEATMKICNLNRFYEFSDFSGNEDDSEEIFLLSEQLRSTDDIGLKKRIKKRIASLCIKGAA